LVKIDDGRDQLSIVIQGCNLLILAWLSH